MKNIITIKTTLVSLILCLLLAGCSDLNGGSKTCTVTGAISMSDVDNSRSATSSFTDWDSVSLYAEQGSSKIAGSVTNGSYSVVLNSSGQWTITAYAESSSTKILQGSVTVTIPDPVESVTNAHIVLLPCFNSEVTGNISLKIKDETTGSKLSKVTFKGTELSAGTATFTNGVATISIPSCQPKSYDVAFSFEDSIGNTLYKCHETITVFSGLTTDTWSGSGTHLRKTAQGTTEFVITDELVEGYGTELVNATDILLYNPYSEGTDSGYEFTLGNTAPLRSTTTSSYSFCFDENGDIFYVSSLGSYKTDISSERENFGSSGTVSLGDSNTNRYFTTIQYDKITQKLYGVITDVNWNSTNENFDNTFTLYEYSVDEMSDSWVWTAFDSTALTNVEKQYVIDGLSSDSILGGKFTIHNGTVYVPYYNNGYKLFKANLSYAVTEGAYYLHAADIGLLDLNLDSSVSGDVTDCMYQDGCLYFLASKKSVSSDQIGTRGAVICVNLFSNKTDCIGWNTQAMDNSALYLYAYASDTDALYVDANKSAHVVAKASEIKGKDNAELLGNIYTASGMLTKDVLFGPKKFIAVKPKKLVIADDGMFFYADDNGCLKYKNANRIVTVDLEDFVITDAEDTSVAFEEDSTGNLIGSGGCGYISATTYYSSNDKTSVGSPYYTESGESKTSVYCCKIPCGD